MLKRLLTAVLVLGLILAFSSTAFTDPTDMPGDKDIRPISKSSATVVDEARTLTKVPVNVIAPGPREAVTQRPRMQALRSPDTTTCDMTNYASYDDGFFNSWARRSTHPTQSGFAMRYDGPNQPGFGIMVNGVHAWILRVAEGVVMDGLANVKVSVYSDVAGLPGTEVYSETFALPVHPNDYVNYTSMLFTNPPVVYGSYHITMWPDLAGPGTDTVVFTSDDAGFPPANVDPGTGRSSVKYTGTWMSIYDYYYGAYPGFNPDFDWYADFCQVYSDCRFELGGGYPGSNNSVYSMPRVYPDGHLRNGIGQRFMTAPGPDTVKTIDIIHYDFGAGAYGPTSTNGLIISFWHDDGTGNIDQAAGPIASFTLAAGLYLFPQTGGTTSGYNEYFWSPPTPVVVYGAWHYTIQASTDIPAAGTFYFNGAAANTYVGGSIRMLNTIPPSAEWLRTGQRLPGEMAAGEIAWLTQVELCKDEFALCGAVAMYDAFTSGYGVGPAAGGWSRRGFAQPVAGTGLATRLDRFRFTVGDDSWFGDPCCTNGSPELDAKVYAVGVGGGPGAVLWSTHLTFAQISMTGWTEVVIPGGLQVGPGDFFIGFEAAYVDPINDYLYFAGDRAIHDPHTVYNGGMWQLANATNTWRSRRLDYADPANGLFEAEYCSVPPSRWTCATPQDFRNAGADYARTLHTNVPLEDAYCDLTLRWKYVDPIFNVTTNRINNSGPVVYDDIVICGFASRYRFLSLVDGSVIGEIAGAGAPYYLPSSGINCTPTIAMVDVGGTPKPIMFVGSGSGSGYRVFAAYDLSTWVGTAPTAVPAQLWSVNAGNYAAMGYTFPGPPQVSHLGATTWTNPIVLNIDDVDMVFFNTNDQYVWAANAATGVKIWGPIVIGGLTYKGMATDGVNLYVSNTALAPTYPLGDVSCWDAATGANVWMLSTAGGLRGAAAMQDFSAESFVSGLAYYGGEIYTVSTTAEVEDPTGALGGLFYRIKASDGAVLSVTPTEHRRIDAGTVPMGGLMIDAATVVLPGSTRWATSNNGGQLFGYNRFTGGQNWVVSEGAWDADAGHWYDGLLTCEDADSDLGFVTNINGYLSCFNPVDGSEYFSRRFNSPANVGGALGISDNGDLLVADRNGAIFCLSKNDNAGNPVPDRPRLEIIDHTPQGNTYGPLEEVWVTIPGVYKNSGCAPLTGTITFSTTPNGSTLGPVASSGSGVNRSTSIADQLTESSSKKMLVALDDVMKFRESLDQRPAQNRAALATPPFFNTTTLPINLNAGQTGDFVLNLRQSLVYRGENVFYAYFQSNDPDYFLDSTILEPQVRGLIVGGCLLDTTTLHFGTGGVNTQWTLNVPRMGHWGDGADNWFMNIGADFDDFYGGYYIYGVSKERLAMNTQDWWVGNGEARAYKALQGDPNVCSDNCKPALLADQIVAMITETGASYSALKGNIVCRTYLDSVQMWAPLDSLGNYGAWNWNTTWLTAGTYNNDSTMGLVTHSRSIGFTQFPAAYSYLGKVVVDFMKTFKRYEDKPPVLNWRIGEWIDYDLGGDTIYFWPGISTCASVGTGARTAGAWGTIKLPFGGGCNSEVYPAMKNALSLEGNQSMNNTAVRGNAYLDSVYYYMGLNVTNFSQGSMVNAPGDQRSHDSWLTHNFTTYLDTLRFAVAHFGNPTLAFPRDPNSMAAPLAHMLNKLCGMERGDVNNSGQTDLADIVYLADYCFMPTTQQCMDDVGQPDTLVVHPGHPGPIPFRHIGDVNADDVVDCFDVAYLYEYYFYYGPCPMSKYIAY